MGLLQRLLDPVLKFYTKRLAQKNLPNYDKDYTLDGIRQPVRIVRDRWAVPHIHAENKEDLFFAQGFVHAQDRLWQMEVNRRVSTGRLSEVFGKLALNTDRIVRTLGFKRLALKDAQRFKQLPIYPLLEAYAKGVNAYLEQQGKDLPAEFRLIRLTPEKWTAIDSLCVARFLAFQMSLGWTHELDRLRLADELGIEKAQKLFPEYPAKSPAALDQIETYKIQDGRLEAFEGPFLNTGGASNNWTVAANKMETGSAALCNDPHLLINVPNIWYENHLISPDLEVTGVSIAGAPLVMIGHNRKIAWGATLAYTDAQDLYIEKFTSESCLQYNSGEHILKATHLEEPIKIKGEREPYIERVIYTHHGPVISDVLNYPKRKITLCSKALQDSDMILGFYGLNMAEGWNDFVRACEKLSVPPLSLVYADTYDNTGYYLTGEVPIRKKRKHLLPYEGWKEENDWEHRVPFKEMPHALNPSKGYFYTCNHKLIEDHYPHYLGDVWLNGYRAQRLDSLFRSQEKYSLDDFKAWQMDFYCPSGKAYAALYANLYERISESQEKLPQKTLNALQRLAQWDGYLTKESVGGCLYQVVKQELLEALFGESLSPNVRGKGLDDALFRSTEFWGHDTNTVLKLIKDQDPDFVKEDTDTLLLKALQKAVNYLSKKIDNKLDHWQWGKLHKIHLHHAMGERKPLDEIFNIGEFPIGGDTDTLCQTAFLPNKHYDGTIIAASYRQIIDMGNLGNSLCSAPVGQAGNHLSPHYKDQVEPWLNGEYKPMVWTDEQIQEYASYQSNLSPKK